MGLQFSKKMLVAKKMILSKPFLMEKGNDARVSQNTINALARYLTHKTKPVKIKYFHGRWKVWCEAITPIEHFCIIEAIELSIKKIRNEKNKTYFKIWKEIFIVLITAKVDFVCYLGEERKEKLISGIMNGEKYTVNDAERMLKAIIAQKRDKSA